MTLSKLAAVLMAIGIAGLVSCSVAPPVAPSPSGSSAPPAQSADLAARYASLERAGGKVFRIDPGASTVRIYAFRAGKAAKVGHNHVLSAPRFTGYFLLPPEGAAKARFDLEFRLDELEIDNPVHRSTLGPAFASTQSKEAVDGTREHMLGPDNLQADRFPLVRIHSVQIAGEAPKFAAKVEIALHGQSRQLWVPIDVQGLPQHLAASGSFVIRQTDFGAQPYSVLGGLIAVQDEVIVEFRLVDA